MNYDLDIELDKIDKERREKNAEDLQKKWKEHLKKQEGKNAKKH